MDIIAHGLYGGAAFVKKSEKSFWTAVWWGIFPDLVAFGWFFPFFILRYGFHREEIMRVEPPALDVIPQSVHMIYNFSHSLIIFLIVFGIVWFFKKRPSGERGSTEGTNPNVRPPYEMLPWALHIVMDIPSHTTAFFPTPFLYPLSSFRVNGVSWGTSWFFFSYWTILILIYVFIFVRKYLKDKK